MVSSTLKNEARFVYLISGSCLLKYPNGQIKLNSGDSIIMKCESFINEWQSFGDDGISEIIIIKLYPDTLKDIYKEDYNSYFNSGSTPASTSVELIAQSKLLEQYLANLNHYFDNPELVSDQLLKIKIQELIHVLTSADKTGKIGSILAELFNPKNHEFKEIIDDNLYVDLKLEDLSSFCRLSLSSFKRKFKTIYGCPPQRYINLKRLQKAKKLLVTTDLRISEIAYKTGFNNSDYFSQKFKTQFNCSPTSYRKEGLN